jgi:tetratricopeptide (TPR) repeat protein
MLVMYLGATSAHAVTNGAAVENRQVADALLEGKRLASKKQWTAALQAVHKARSVTEKSNYAEYKIDEFEAYLLTQQRKYAQAAQAFERMARSDNAPRGDLSGHWKTAAQLYLQTQEYGKAAQAADQALKLDPKDPQLLELLGQAQYLAKDYRAAASTLKQLVNNAESNRRQPGEEWLQLLLASYDQLHDNEQVAATWELLLEHYPKPEYWRTVLKLKAQRASSDMLESGYRRLMFDVGVLDKPADYEELALSAIDAGAPSEAIAVLEKGFENGALTGPQEARYRRMLEFAKQKAATNDSNLNQLTANAQSLPAQSSVELGRLHLLSGDYQQAIAELRRGIQSGKVEHADQARIDLGIAYLKSDQLEQARRTFAAVDSKSEWHDLAELWELRAASD